MNQELYDILKEAGWRLGFPKPSIKPDPGWWTVWPLGDNPVTTAQELVNLLRLGGWDARPNRKAPTRAYVKIT